MEFFLEELEHTGYKPAKSVVYTYNFLLREIEQKVAKFTRFIGPFWAFIPTKF